LDTILAVSDAVVFARNEDDHLVPAARLQSATSEPLSTSRNSAWRESINFSQRAMASGEIVTHANDSTMLVAVPLRHEERTSVRSSSAARDFLRR